MFCTSLRGRPSFAAALVQLRSPPLALREARLNTHDLEIQLKLPADGNKSNASVTRRLRVLLLAATDIEAAKLPESMQRIQHFAALTGGRDLIIVFLLSLSATPISASAPAISKADDTAPMDGMHAYTKLQAEMINHVEIPNTPILPLQRIERLSQLLARHLESLGRPMPLASPSTTPFELLQLCTANPPMPHQTAYILTDLFPNLKELAAACSSVTSAPNSSSPSARAAGMSSQLTYGYGYDTDTDMDASTPGLNAQSRLKTLRVVVGDSACRDIVDYWKEEWTVD